MNNFKKLALAASIGSLMFSASAAQAHVSYNLTPGLGGTANPNNTAKYSATWTGGTPTGLDGTTPYTGNLPAHWVANIHNSPNPNKSMDISDDLAITAANNTGVDVPATYNLETPNNKWNPASSWSMVLDYGLIKMDGTGHLTITVSADDNSTFTPGFTVWRGWDATSTSNIHQAWNGPTSSSNPYNLDSNELSYLGHAFTTSSGGTANPYIDQSYKVNLATTAVPVPAAAWLFGGALMSLIDASRRKSVMPA